MKKCRFLWSAHRITERQKAGKARSIKGKQLKNSRSTVSKQLVAHHSSANVKHLLTKIMMCIGHFPVGIPENVLFSRFYKCKSTNLISVISRNLFAQLEQTSSRRYTITIKGVDVND